MADPAQGSCRFASHRERSSIPCADFRRAPCRPLCLLPRRFLFRAEIFSERRHSGTPSAKSRSRQVLLEVDARCRPPCVTPPFAIWCYLSTCIARACAFYFIHRRVLISPLPRWTRSSNEHRMGDKGSLRGGQEKKNPARWQIIITGGVPKNGKISTASYRLRQRGEVERRLEWAEEDGKGPPGD